jgi:hypothetical protein
MILTTYKSDVHPHRDQTEEISLPADTLTDMAGAADVLAGIDELLEA